MPRWQCTACAFCTLRLCLHWQQQQQQAHCSPALLNGARPYAPTRRSLAQEGADGAGRARAGIGAGRAHRGLALARGGRPAGSPHPIIHALRCVHPAGVRGAARRMLCKQVGQHSLR